MREIGHEDSMPLTTDPARHPAVFAAAFNSGDPGALDAVYEERGILVPEPGRPVGGAGRTAANAALQSIGAPIRVAPRHVYVVNDLALLIVDWTIDGAVRGTATDVARRGPDGRWRYVIDNPFGVAGPPE